MSTQENIIRGGIRSAIVQLVRDGATIVELGNGFGSENMVTKYAIWSVVDDKNIIQTNTTVRYIHAPIVPLSDKITHWYDPTVLSELLPKEYDLIIINGPRGSYGKIGVLSHLELFRTDVPIIINNTIREHEAGISRELAFKLNRPLYVFWNFSIIAPNLLTRLQVATIQREATRALEKIDEVYSEKYFFSSSTIISPNRSEWHNRLSEFKSKQDEFERINSSWSYRLGNFLTYPIRLIANLYYRKK